MRETAAQPSQPGFNDAAANRLREAADLLAHQNDNPYRVAAYRRAAEAVAAFRTDLRDLLEAGGIKALEEIPGVGGRIASGLAELARTGRWTYLEGLRGSAEPRDVFCAIPGVGPTLAKRLHETLHVETLEQLEAALHEEGPKPVAGIGPRRLAILRAALGQMLARIRSVRTGPADEPPVDVLLDVDREYRSKVQARVLRTIAPKRFNPKGEAWLPILHTERGKWHFTALFFPRPRARQGSGLGRALFPFRQRRRGTTHCRHGNARSACRRTRCPWSRAGVPISLRTRRAGVRMTAPPPRIDPRR